MANSEPDHVWTAGDRVILVRFKGRPAGIVLGRVPPRHYYVVVRQDNVAKPIVCVPEELEFIGDPFDELGPLDVGELAT